MKFSNPHKHLIGANLMEVIKFSIKTKIRLGEGVELMRREIQEGISNIDSEIIFLSSECEKVEACPSH